MSGSAAQNASVAVSTTTLVFATRHLMIRRGSRVLSGRVGVARSAPTDGRHLRCRVGGRVVRIPVLPLLVTVGVSVMSPTLAAVCALVLSARAVGAPRRADRARRRAWSTTVPDLVELVRLALGSGCTIHLTLLLIECHAGGTVSDMLNRTATSLKEGRSTAEALVELQQRVGAPVRPLCSALLGSERYGLPVTATLEALAVEARLARQRDAELRSRRLPVLLIFPLVTCILPAFALLTVVPLLGGGLSSLSW